jgi:3-hydroxyisobutyryl-CoA hydrolase
VGVTALLVDKSKERPKWSPGHVDDVADSDIVAKFFSLDSEFLQKTPKIRVPEVLRNVKSIDPMRFALPREDDIGLVVKGAHGSSSAFAITLPELLEKYESLTANKVGVREKILEVASRKTTSQRDSEGKEWLAWKH